MTMIERVARAIQGKFSGLTDDRANDIARAAIAAMREPTETMQEAGYREAIHAMTVWQTMIDAAREEK